MYKSPVEIIYGNMKQKFENDVFRAVQEYGINVDKEELIKALSYDRDQYAKGYQDGLQCAMNSLVRCKDCHNAEDIDGVLYCHNFNRNVEEYGYCYEGC